MLARLAGVSLLTFSVDGATVTAHRLVTRVIRENLTAAGSLAAVCRAAARLLDGQASSLEQSWHQDRPAARDLVEQIIALDESAARCPSGSDPDRLMIKLQWWAAWFLGEFGDSVAQAILVGERLLANQEQTLGLGHPDTLTSRDNLAVDYRVTGRTSEAITMHEQTLATRERILGPAHPDTLQSRGNLAIAYRDAGREEDARGLET